MKLFDRIKKRNTDTSGLRRYTDEERKVGNLIGATKNRDDTIVDHWKNLLRSKGIKITDRLLGIMRYDLDQQELMEIDKKPIAQLPDVKPNEGEAIAQGSAIIQMSGLIQNMAQENTRATIELYNKNIQDKRKELTEVSGAIEEARNYLHGLEIQLEQKQEDLSKLIKELGKRGKELKATNKEKALPKREVLP